jgi:hypothetical protein
VAPACTCLVSKDQEAVGSGVSDTVLSLEIG